MSTTRQELIYPRDAIVNNPRGYGELMFIRGPFDGVPSEHYEDPYVEGVDFECNMTREYITINSCTGRFKAEISWLEIQELAERGGWDCDFDWQEVNSGGADVIPDYSARAVAAGLRNVLEKNPHLLHLDGRRIDKSDILKLIDIFEGGPVTLPW